MKRATPGTTHKAFTLIELLVVVAILGIGLAVYLPMIDRGCRLPMGGCMNNLRQTGLGLLMYASDHADQFPWEISTNSSVMSEVVESYPAYAFFLALTNYALPPSKFVCPSDEFRTAATNYSTFNNSNLSYFAALSATMTSGTNVWRLILAGDRHLSVDGQPLKPGLHTLGANPTPAWTDELHKPENKLTSGSLLFADGHVQFTPAKDLARISKDQPVATTRLVIP